MHPFQIGEVEGKAVKRFLQQDLPAETQTELNEIWKPGMKEKQRRPYALLVCPHVKRAAPVYKKNVTAIHRIPGAVYSILADAPGSYQQSDRRREFRAFIRLLHFFGKKEMVGEDRRRDLVPNIERFGETLQEHDRNIGKITDRPGRRGDNANGYYPSYRRRSCPPLSGFRSGRQHG